MSEHTPDPGQHHDPHARPPGHERKIDRDINLRSIALTVGGLMVGTVLAFVAMWWMHEYLLGQEVARDPAPPELSEARENPPPPMPRLQASPEADMEVFRAEQQAQLTAWGWKDEEAGVVRIPVERAMEVLAEEGRGALSLRPDPTAGDGNEATTPAAEAAVPAPEGLGTPAAAAPADTPAAPDGGA